MPPSPGPITDLAMRLEQLEYFAAVSEHGSLRRAAEHLHVSQPALSEAISKLERELGVTLLDRHRSGARISRAGLELLQPVGDVLKAVARLRALAGDELAARRVLRIGTVAAGTVKLLFPAVRDFQVRNPGATVELRTLQQEEIQTALIEGTLDLGLVNLLDGDDIPPGLEPDTLVVGRPVAVLPAGHPLAALAEVSADDLRSAHFLAMRSGYLMYRFAHRLFGNRPPLEWHSADGAEMGKMMAAEGIGVTVLPDYSVQGDPLERAGLIVARPIAGDRTTVTMAAVRRRASRTPSAVREMLDLLRGHAEHRPALGGGMPGPEGAAVTQAADAAATSKEPRGA